MKTIGRVGCAALSLLFVGSAPAQIVWSFTMGTGDPDPSNLPEHVTPGTLTSGNMAGTTLTFDSTSTCTTAGSSAGNNAGMRTVSSASLSVATSSYFEFTLSPDPAYRLSVTAVSLNVRRTSSGPSEVNLLMSMDDYSMSSGGKSLNSGIWTTVTWGDLAVLGLAGAPITFRIYGAPSGTASSTNWRIDDLAVTAGAIAVPEPATYAVLCGGLVLVGSVVIRRCQARRNPHCS